MQERVGSKSVVRSVDLGPAEVKKFEEESLVGRGRWREGGKDLIMGIRIYPPSHRYIEGRGIDIGEVKVMVYAQTLQGKRYVGCHVT